MFSILILSSFLLNTIYCFTVAKFPGNFTIGALLNIRTIPFVSNTPTTCGRLKEAGIQELEVALLVRDMINNSTEILPGVRLGLEVYDTCSWARLAIRQCLHFIRSGPIQENVPNFVEKNVKLRNGVRSAFFNESSIIGVIGPTGPAKTDAVPNLLNLFNIPQIRVSHTQVQTNDEDVSPSAQQLGLCDTCHARVVRDILKKFNWTYVALIHSNEAATARYFRDVIKHDDEICIGKEFSSDIPAADSVVDDIIREISEDQSLNVIICFCEVQKLRQLFFSIKKMNLTFRFTIIASKYYEYQRQLLRNVAEEAWGTIFVHFDGSSTTFPEYYQSLKPLENTRNPWFAEFWEDKFHCTIPMKPPFKRVITNHTFKMFNRRKSCRGNESLAENYRENTDIAYTMTSMWRLAHALHSMMTEICGHNYIGVCQNMYPFNTSKLMDHLRNSSFQDENELVANNNKDSTLSYKILNYQKISDNNFDLIKIGDWTKDTLRLSTEWQSRRNEPVMSTCSIPCQVGFHKVFRSENVNQHCCWNCEPCDVEEYVSTDKEKCIKCSEGEMLNSNRTGCVAIPVQSRDWSEPITIMIVTFTMTSVIATLITFCIFLKYKDTPVVKASSRELCYMILCSMILCHISVFTNLAEPTKILCALSRTLPAVSLTMLYASLFTKTNRIARILAQSQKKFPNRKLRLMSASSQVAITFLCVVMEIIVCFGMLLIDPPEISKYYPSRHCAVIICKTSIINAVPAVFVVILHVLCIVYAIKTRKVPGNFNEAKFMGFKMLFSSITFIFFITLYLGSPFKVPTLCMSLTLNASFALIFLFFPKLYIIILKPEKNNRLLFITNKSIRMHIGTCFDSNTTKSSSQYSMKSQTENDFVISENRSRLRRNVGTQTSSKFFRNTLSPTNDDNELLFNADGVGNVNSRDDNTNTSSESNRNVVKMINNDQEGVTSSMTNILIWVGIFSLRRIVKCLNYVQSLNLSRHIHRMKRNDHSQVISPEECR